VEHGHAAGEARREAPYRLGCQGDLRHEDNSLLAALQGQVNGPHVDLRLAAAGDAVEKEGRGRIHRVEGVVGVLAIVGLGRRCARLRVRLVPIVLVFAGEHGHLDTPPDARLVKGQLRRLGRSEVAVGQRVAPNLGRPQHYQVKVGQPP